MLENKSINPFHFFTKLIGPIYIYISCDRKKRFSQFSINNNSFNTFSGNRNNKESFHGSKGQGATEARIWDQLLTTIIKR